jgi:hypothetical protein
MKDASDASSPQRGVLAALVSLLFLSGPALADQSFDFRLSPGPRLVGTRADSSGSARLHADLKGNVLTLSGDYQGLLAAPATAQLMMGPLPGVRGPKLADLTIAPAASGAISGKVTLNKQAMAAFAKGGLYVEITNAAAPEGDLWGWVMPPSQ